MSTTESTPPVSRREREQAARDRMRRLMALGQIRRYPDPILTERSREITEFSDDLRALVDRMGRLMRDAHGVGLAGNQVGLVRRVLVFSGRDEDEDVVGLINPVIVDRSEETAVDEEGCLSLGPVRLPVERSVSVVVEAHDATGEPLRIEAEGLRARILQHEIDHLDGVLIIERTTDEARREAMAELRRLTTPE